MAGKNIEEQPVLPSIGIVLKWGMSISLECGGDKLL